MADLDTRTILDTIEILKSLKTLFSDQNPYLPVYSALGGAFVGAVSAFIPNYITARLRERREKKSLTLAIYAEIKATIELIRVRSYLQSVQGIIEQMNRGLIGPTTFQVIVPDDYSIVFKNNVSNIGILDPDLQVKVVQFYQLLEAVIQDVKPGGLLNISPQGENPFRELLVIGEQMLTLGQETISLIEKTYRLRTAQQVATSDARDPRR